MRELHVVSLSEDGRSVLLATTKDASRGGFRVALDSKLAAAVRGDLPRPGETDARDSDLTPKEIQARLRAGESPEEIAAAAGVPVARVERFSGPVLSERERILDEARGAFVSRGRLGTSTLPLGPAVDSALAETPSLRPESVGWTARRLDTGHWLVQLSYVSRARARTCSWVFEPATKVLTPSDAASAAMGHAGAETGRRSGVSAVSRPRAATRPRAKASGSSRPRTSAKKTAKKSAAPPAAKPAKAAGTKAAGTRAQASKGAAAKPAGSKTNAKAGAKPPAKRAAAAAGRAVTKAASPTSAKPGKGRAAASAPAKRAARKAAPVPKSPPTLRVVPQAEPEQEPTPVPTRPRRTGSGRASVPAWADVLLGTAPKSDRNGG